MGPPNELITGEFRRVFDERYRIALPPEMTEPIAGPDADCVLAKERKGCLSLWNPERWQKKFAGPVELIQHKLSLDLLPNDVDKVQRLARLLSTRSRPVKLGQRGRLLVPEGFREFLAAEPNSEVMVVGAGLCVELWNVDAWTDYVSEDIGQFHSLFKELLA